MTQTVDQIDAHFRKGRDEISAQSTEHSKQGFNLECGQLPFLQNIQLACIHRCFIQYASDWNVLLGGGSK